MLGLKTKPPRHPWSLDFIPSAQGGPWGALSWNPVTEFGLKFNLVPSAGLGVSHE